MSSTGFNILQINRGILGQPPLSCHCQKCQPGMYFECHSCGYFQPWCMGTDPDRPDICDECRVLIRAAEQALKDALRGVR